MQREKFEVFAEEQKEQQERYNIGDGRMVTIINFNEKILGCIFTALKWSSLEKHIPKCLSPVNGAY